jgi:vitamin B12 transporter
MKHFYYSAAVLLLFQLVTIAQKDSVKTTLSEIVVTATKTETPYYELGSSVTVINSDDISKKQLTTVVDVLREAPGLTVIQQGGPGKLTNVFMRGANPNHTLVICDGVVLNDASSTNNAFDFSRLNTNDIEKIEIVRGPQSTLYGSDAIAGVINIITKHGTGRPQYSFSGETGSNNYYRGNFSSLGELDKVNYSFQLSRSTTDGISAADSRYGNNEKDSYSNTSFTSNLGYDFSPDVKLSLIYKYTKANSGLDQSGKYGDDPNYTYNSEEQLFNGRLYLSLLNGIWQAQFNASYNKSFNHSLDLTDAVRPNTSADGYYKFQRVKYDWQNNFRIINNNTITLGIETQSDTASSSYLSTSDYGPYNSIFPAKAIRTTSTYVQDQVNIDNSFFATAGIRYDKNQMFGGVTTFRIAPAYLIRLTNTKIKMSYGTGFKAPSLFYLFDPLFGNPNLQPEKSTGWDAGIEQYFDNGNILFGVTYFNLKFKDMFGYDSNYREINIAKASSYGLELTASLLNIGNYSFNTSYTYTKTNDDYNDGSGDYNKPLLRRPENQISFNMNYRFNEKLNSNFQMNYVGKRWDKDFTDEFNPVRVELPDYLLINLVASYKLFSYLEFNARIENLLDKKYEEILYYGTLGRSFYAGVSFTL